MQDTMKELKERVKKGSDFLRTLDPFWFQKINTDTIDIYSAQNCILGQVFGSYPKIADRLYYEYGWEFWGFDNIWAQHGFDFALHHDSEDCKTLLELWQKIVIRLKNATN